MNIPKEENIINRAVDVTIQFGKDKKMKVIKRVVGSYDESKNSESERKYKTKESHEEGMKIYLQYFQRNFAKFSNDYNLYNVYTLEQVNQKMKETINDIMVLINMDYDYAYRFMNAYKFNSDKLIEAWFRNPKEVLEKAQLSHLMKEQDFSDHLTNDIILEEKLINAECTLSKEFPTIQKSDDTKWNGEKYICPILLNEYKIENTYALKCGHRYSKECLERYLKTSIENDFDEDIINKKCIEPKCKEFFKQKDWECVLDEKNELLQKYQKILLQIFIKYSHNLKKCPYENCEYVIESVMLKDNTVICKCGYNFCFNCCYEFHRPVTCSVIKKWNDLLTKGDHNIKWIQTHTKNCPNCAKSIEKTSGCMNVKCVCGFSFCWLCLQAWVHHKGGFYKCNQYIERDTSRESTSEAANEATNEDTDEIIDDVVYKHPDKPPNDNQNLTTLRPQQGKALKLEERKRAHKSLNKLNHFKTRFDAHQHGEDFAIRTQLLFVSQFCKMNNVGPTHRIQNFQNSIIQTIRCRKILKWSYAFAYFVEWKDENKKYLFEYHQGQLEKNLDTLQRKTESIDLAQFLNPNLDVKIVREIDELTKTVDVFFKNVCDFIESTFSGFTH
ncbi:hypothetical protein, conserved [Plasmodium gonderi]|uniref:RBR-type E3 ubiquitin transferase n=1 Tax=Plasmodium gonderi TaxID=77519 RepID=A0A1Y1JEV5_PLAGO|nr:hypothetical protein, conserved [Plasmodium gonderi]GAW80780.1 hypothetical protein, conserved [Plasmodium gonderi]